MESLGYSSNFASPRPNWGFTQLGLYLSIRCTFDGDSGRSVSIADAKGWTSSGHWGSNAHRADAHLEQKFRRAELVTQRLSLPGRRARYTETAPLPRTFSDFALP